MADENGILSNIKQFLGRRRTIYTTSGILIVILAVAVTLLFVRLPPTGVKNLYNVNVIDPQGSCLDHSLNFQPSSITLVIGINSTVIWTNRDSCIHNAHADLGSFYSGIMQPGSAFTFTFNNRGTYTYHCDYHSWMRATINVITS